MKFVKWKILIITCIVCLLPILLGTALWNKLPDTIAIHFNINNVPDNYASKAFAVFGLPFLMVLFQVFCCITNDIKSCKHGESKKTEKMTKWILPFVTIVVQAVIFGYALDMNIDIRKTAALIIGVIFIVSGCYIPEELKFKKHNIDAEKVSKISKFVACETIVMGILSIATIFLPPVSMVIWLFLLIPYTAVSIIYMSRNRK